MTEGYQTTGFCFTNSFSTATLAAAVCVAAVFFGCETSEEQIVERLDQQEGVESFVLGDSLYSRFYNHIRSEPGRTIEFSVLNTTITPYHELPKPQRFLFGLEIKSTKARAIGGKVSAITIRFGELDSVRYQELQDSLRARYGPPTAQLDTTLLNVALAKKEDVTFHRWKGNQIWLQSYADPEPVSDDSTRQLVRTGVNIHRRDLITEIQKLQTRVDTLLQNREINSLKKVGEFPLLSTNSHPMIEEVERESDLGDDTNTEKVVDYEHLRSFFGLPNPMGPSRTQPVITTRASHFIIQSDSLLSLDVNIAEEKYDPNDILDKSAFKSYDEVAEIVEKNLGPASLKVERRTLPYGEDEIETDILYHWYGRPFSVELSPTGNGTEVTFSRTMNDDRSSDILPQRIFPSNLNRQEW